MKIKAIAPWFGGKRTMAPDIIRELGEHRSYFEPFCGSMAVLLRKPRVPNETVNDLHRDLTNLARVLQSDSLAPQLYDRLCRTLVCDGLLEEAAGHLEGPACDSGAYAKVSRAYWYFIGSWMARNGVAGTDKQDYQLAVRWTAGGGSPTIRFRSCVESIPAWHQRLSNVTILNRDAFSIIPKFEDEPHVAIYVDPPYLRETRDGFGTGSGRSHSGRYAHEFTHGTAGGSLLDVSDDHERLADLLKAKKKARVVVSYYDCDRVRELYDGWTVVNHTRNKNLHAQNGRGPRQKDAPEVLIINGPSYAEKD